MSVDRGTELVPPGSAAAVPAEPSDVRGLWGWPLRGLSVPYGLAVRARAALHRRGWLVERSLPCRVISVGNLTVGGTGKTPVTIWLVHRLLNRGLRVGVLSRGYRRLSREPRLLVSDGHTVLAGQEDAGDEPHLIASRCPGAVVAVGADRYRLGRWVLERFPLDCVVLDDGFQHLALKRDVDLLLVDASAPSSLDALLPAGRLREPLGAASRATAVLLTRADDATGGREVVNRLESAVGGACRPIPVRFVAEAFVSLETGTLAPPAWASGRRALAFSGIGNTAAFRSLLDRLGLRVLDEVAFRDHHRYTAADLSAVGERATRCGAEVVVTTEKDAVKVVSLTRRAVLRQGIWALRLGTEIMEDVARLERLIFGDDER